MSTEHIHNHHEPVGLGRLAYELYVIGEQGRPYAECNAEDFEKLPAETRKGWETSAAGMVHACRKIIREGIALDKRALK